MSTDTDPHVLDPATRWRVSDLLSRYGHVVDNQEWQHLPQIFTDSAVLDAQYTAATGLDEIQKYLESFGPWRSHHTINTIAEYDGGPHRIKAWSRLLVVEASGTSIPGDYLDILVPTADGWRIQNRRISLRNRPDTAPDGQPWHPQTFTDWDGR